MFLFFLTGGLFLGWSLGSNDAANIFGTAVGSKMLRFRTAATIASIFIILGAVVQGSGTTETLGKLGTVDAIAGAFTVAICAAITVFAFNRNKLPASTTQAIVGSIIGWNLFTGNPTDYSTLTTILSTWIVGPILGIIFSALLFILTRWLLRKLQIHLIKLDGYIRWGLIIVGAFGAYSLGANNIANVVGVFIGSIPPIVVDFGLFQITGIKLVFLLGGISIAIGVFTYGSKVMETVGRGIMNLTPEAAIVVVLAHSLVLFIFSSTSLSILLENIGLPRIPLVPVSSSQLVVGAIIGIGLVKGVQELQLKTIGNILLGWLLIPLVSCILSFFALFFIQNVFDLNVTGDTNEQLAIPSVTEVDVKLDVANNLNLVYPFAFAIAILVLVPIIYLIFRQRKSKIDAQNALLKKQKELIEAQSALTELELRAMRRVSTSLASKLEFKRNELVNYALNIIEQQNFLSSILSSINEIKKTKNDVEQSAKLDNLMMLIKQQMNNSDKVKVFNLEVDKIHRDFNQRLATRYPDLTESDRRLAILIRLDFSSKEIAPLLNISPKSVEIARYRLRKKLELKDRENLTEFLKSL